MKILYFSQFYMPESIAPAFRATENSKIWEELGHDVTIFTGYPNYPTGKIFDGYHPKLLTKEKINGVNIFRSKLSAKPNTSIVRRLQNALSYFFFGMVNICFNQKRLEKDYDVVLGTSGIIFNALLACLYAQMHKKPFVFELRDITYMQMQATGKRYNSITVRGMKWLELYLCKKAKKVVVVTNGFKKTLVDQGIDKNKIKVITNGVDVDKASGIYDEDKPFVLSYFGTLGISQDIMDTFKYAEVILKIIDGLQYLIIGEGAQKKEIEDLSKNKQFIKMLPGMPAEELESYYCGTQMSIITLKKSDNFKYTIPSKLFQVMGRGIAVLFIGPNGETAEIIKKYNAGIVLTSSSVDKNIAQLEEFFASENWRKKLYKMGCNGRKAVEEHYTRSKLAEEYIEVLELAR
ncbi:TPA: glycosyltransferase family 4 protein [Enterococcus faecium]